MRTLHDDALAALDEGRFGVRCLLKGEFDDGNFCIWDDFGNITVGEDVYIGKPGRFTVSGVVSEKGATVPNIEITLSGLDPEVIALVNDSNWHQRPIIVQRLVFAVEAPQALHIMPEFAGFLDQITWRDAADGTTTLVARAESASRELSRSYVRTRSDADQRERDPDDGFLEFAASAINEPINWGGRPQAAGKSKPSGLAGLFNKWF